MPTRKAWPKRHGDAHGGGTAEGRERRPKQGRRLAREALWERVGKGGGSTDELIDGRDGEDVAEGHDAVRAAAADPCRTLIHRLLQGVVGLRRRRDASGQRCGRLQEMGENCGGGGKGGRLGGGGGGEGG